MSLLRYLPLMWVAVGIAIAIVWQIGLVPDIGGACRLSNADAKDEKSVDRSV